MMYISPEQFALWKYCGSIGLGFILIIGAFVWHGYLSKRAKALTIFDVINNKQNRAAILGESAMGKTWKGDRPSDYMTPEDYQRREGRRIEGIEDIDRSRWTLTDFQYEASIRLSNLNSPSVVIHKKGEELRPMEDFLSED